MPAPTTQTSVWTFQVSLGAFTSASDVAVQIVLVAAVDIFAH
jgi:hypothetical protein